MSEKDRSIENPSAPAASGSILGEAVSKATMAIFLALTSSAMLPCQSMAVSNIEDYNRLDRWEKAATDTTYGSKLVATLKRVNRALKYNSTDKRALYTRGYIYGVIGCTDSAIVDLTRAIRIDPLFAEAHTERGICYMDKEETGYALSDLNRAIKLSSWSGKARLARGRILTELGRLTEAERDLTLCQLGRCKFEPVLPGELPANVYHAADYYLWKVYERLGRKIDADREYNCYCRSFLAERAGFVHRSWDKPPKPDIRSVRLGYLQ